ncbi:hypothetical protein HAX54_052314 [Datura stramonium]|uniref:Uncharacterized protein n=1 Tax=Datura stramonium TaxID=4076 RepID=A0ABS8SZS5_DATST|nr:hypothetical protein [Datura stramonium]
MGQGQIVRRRRRGGARTSNGRKEGEMFPDCLRSLVQTVAEIAVKAVDLCGNSGIYGRFCELCNQILREVLNGEHGDQGFQLLRY